jgi:hypothetical protein
VTAVKRGGDAPAMSLDLLLKEGVVMGDDRTHLGRVLFPRPGGAFDVG